jgi:hypothetical protein
MTVFSRKHIPAASIDRHAAFCQRNNYWCDRCSTVVAVADRTTHAALHEHVPCECGAMIEQQLLEAHADRDCPLRFVGCSFCGARVRANARDAHEADCGCKTDPCEMCGGLVMRKGAAPRPWSVVVMEM